MSRPPVPLMSSPGSTLAAAPDAVSHAASPLSAADFDFALPEALIAQHPAAEREQSRQLDLGERTIQHRHFAELPELLLTELGRAPLLVLNDTRALPARLLARMLLAVGALRRPEHDGGGRA